METSKELPGLLRKTPRALAYLNLRGAGFTVSEAVSLVVDMNISQSKPAVKNRIQYTAKEKKISEQFEAFFASKNRNSG